ncbi:hypothetical protein B9Z55_010915 [Caenorhabditis nigoni]|nr:hypothetical protein B9Z55_010915 [Caenorhabditis nigoni]
MSLIANIEQQRLSESTVCGTILRYIPITLLQSIKVPADYKQHVPNDEASVQLILSNSDNMLRMYGTAQELLLDLKIFQNFPLSHRRLGINPKEPYNKIPIVYRNTDGEAFMNKADAFCLVQNTIVFDSLNSFRLYFSMEAILLKSHEETIKGICEFFKFDGDCLPKLLNEFPKFHRNFLTQKSSTIREDWNYEKALKMFKAALPVYKEQEYSGFEKDLKAFFDSKSGNFHDVCIAFMSFADYMKSLILATPEMFLPYDKETNSNCPIVVRVFESHGAQFVMKCELFKAINIRNPDSKLLECKEIDGKLMTMSYDKVQRKYKDQIGNIEFLIYPIVRTGHKAVPIMTPSGGHCILAVDCLFEILNELIFGYNIFQKIGTGNQNMLCRFFIRMNTLFSSHHKSIFLVTLEEQDRRRAELIEFWRSFKNIPAKHVRDVAKNGFTVQNLKDQLKYLGLTETFPEIQDYAETVYSEVFSTKKEEFLRTCDMFKAVGKCLLNCIFKQFPMLHLFLHTQNSCYLFPKLNCALCISRNETQFKSTNWTEPHFKKTISTCSKADPENTYLCKIKLPDRTRLINNFYGVVNFFLWIFQFFGFISFSLATKTGFDVWSKFHKDKKDPCIRKTSPGDTQKTSVLAEAPERKKKASEDIQKTSRIEKQPAVEINQSKCCSKCLRTSEMCNEAKKELRSTQNRLEKYEKKAKRTDEVEIQMREMEAEMKKLKKEVKERESVVKKKDTEIVDLKRNMLKLEAKAAKMQLAEKNHSISQNELLEKITKLSDQLKMEKEKNKVMQCERIDELTSQLEHQKEIVQLMEREIQQNKDRLNSEICQKERGFEELRAALTIMSNEKESIQSENRNLRERIASIAEAPPTPPAPESPLEGPTHHRFALLGFQKIKDSLYHKKQLKQAKEMVEKMKSSTNLVEIHQMADYEYYQFEGRLLKYTKEVELNIQRIKETRDVSMVTPLPDSPEFSKRFVNLYWKIINNQSMTSSEIEVSDSECFICTEEMASDQKTLQCEECRKVTHFECASKWLKIHRSCPHCRREMLDPNEFPNLS